MLNCQRATRLFSDSGERKLTTRERLSLKMHIMMCSACRHFGRHMDILRKLSRHYASSGSDPGPQDDEHEK